MERYNKTKAERRELIFKMDYILLMFLTEKNLLSEFLDECYVPSRYLDINSLTILSAFPWRDPNMYKWNSAQLEFEIYNVSTELRIKEILGRR
jgi:hypothetical protein